MPLHETDDGLIYYELLGPEDGPPLTLLHNFMSAGRTAWGPMLDDLTAVYRVLLPDLPGHARSQGYPDRFNYTVIARQLGELMRRVRADTGHLAGCSAGGMIAQLMVHHRFATPATLTLISTTYTTDAEATPGVARLDPANFQAGPRWLEATARLHDPLHYPGYFEKELLAAFTGARVEDAIDLPLAALARWRLPACIIQGECDEFFPPPLPNRMAETIPNAELHLIPEQTHALIFRQPALVGGLLRSFLAAHAAPTAGQRNGGSS